MCDVLLILANYSPENESLFATFRTTVFIKYKLLLCYKKLKFLLNIYEDYASVYSCPVTPVCHVMWHILVYSCYAPRCVCVPCPLF